MPRSSTSFKKGQSGNPAGRRKNVHNVEELARSYTEDAIRALYAALQEPKERVGAASVLLNRGWGMPRATTDVNMRNLDAMGPDLPPRAENWEEWIARRSAILEAELRTKPNGADETKH